MTDAQAAEVPQEAADETLQAEVQGPSDQERAEMNGWKDKDAWVKAGRDPDQHTGFEEFNTAGDDRHQITKANLRDLENKYAKQERTIETMQKFQQQNLDMVKADADMRVKDALDSMDPEQIESAYANKAQAEKNATEFSQEQGAPAPSAEAVAWVARNGSWYNVDRELTMFANNIDREVSAQNPNFTSDQVFAEVDARMAKYLPQPATPRPAVNTVSSGRRPSSGKKSGFDSLSPELKANFDSMGQYYTNDAAGKKKYFESCQRYDANKAGR
jgi:uncharacterized coiled-coil protein SlyX